MKTRNILKLPLVLLIRAPIMLALEAVVLLGSGAERLQDAISPYLPALERDR